MRKGFTLLELLIVIIIIGVLAIFALPAMFGSVSRAKEAKAVHLLGEVRNAQNMRIGMGDAALTAFPITVTVNTGEAVRIVAPTGDYVPGAMTATDCTLTAQAVCSGCRSPSINYATGAITWA